MNDITFCPRCRTNVLPNCAGVCPSCGGDFSPETATAIAAEEPRTPRRTFLLRTVITGVALLVAGFVAEKMIWNINDVHPYVKFTYTGLQHALRIALWFVIGGVYYLAMRPRRLIYVLGLGLIAVLFKQGPFHVWYFRQGQWMDAVTSYLVIGVALWVSLVGAIVCAVIQRKVGGAARNGKSADKAPGGATA